MIIKKTVLLKSRTVLEQFMKIYAYVKQMEN